jgi:hypothetical protein
VYIAGTLGVSPDKLLVSWRAFILRISRQHALDAHADALDILDRTPALGPEEIEADDSVAVDVRVHGDWTGGRADKGNFRRFWG